MRNSLRVNSVHVKHTGTGVATLTTPEIERVKPCGRFITGLLFVADGALRVRLNQEHEILFPVRSVGIGSGFFEINGIAGSGYWAEFNDLWIPVNPDLDLSICYSDATLAGTNLWVTVTMASEDQRSLFLEAFSASLKNFYAALRTK